MPTRSPSEGQENILQERIPDILRKEILEDPSIPPENQTAIAQLLIEEGLAGIDSEKAAQLVRDTPGATDAMGLAQLVGISTPAAEALRQHHFDQQTHPKSLAASLAGVDTPLSWRIRITLNQRLISMGPDIIRIMAQSLLAMDIKYARDIRLALFAFIESQKQDISQKMPGLEAKLTFKDEAELIDPRLRDAANQMLELDRMTLVLASEMLEHTEIKAPLDHPDKATLEEIDAANNNYLTLCCGEAMLVASLAGIDSDHAWEIRYKTFQKIMSLKDNGTVSSIPEDELKIRAREETGVDTMGIGGQSMEKIDRRQTYELRFKIVNLRRMELLLSGLAASLIGLDSQEANGMRDYFFHNNSVGPDINENNRRADLLYIQSLGLSSFAGVDSPRSWEIRNEILDFLGTCAEHGNPVPQIMPDSLAASLGGLEREEAQAMRTSLIEKDLLSVQGKVCSVNCATLAAIRASRSFNLPAQPRQITAETFFPRPKQPKQTAGASLASSLAERIHLAVLQRLKPRN